MTPDRVVSDDNLSRAWARALTLVGEDGPGESQPLVVSIANTDNEPPRELPSVRAELDGYLGAPSGKKKTALPSIDETASTIFPYQSWVRQGKPDRHQFFRWYMKERYPRLQRRNPLNAYGTYFQRMIAYQPALDGTDADTRRNNQLEMVINAFIKRKEGARPRRSALQIAVIDPRRDLTGQALRGFPCLQQISFSYGGPKTLAVCAYYPTQYIIDRAYGNYLGLMHLGLFVAHELGLKLTSATCFVAHPVLGTGRATRFASARQVAGAANSVKVADDAA